MKSKQVLDVQQMQHLQELGLELDYNTVLSWIIDERGKDKPLLCISSEAVDYVDFSHYCLPAYTLQDVLDALPASIKHKDFRYYLVYNKSEGFIGYYGVDFDGNHRYARYEELYNGIDGLSVIDAAYELLVWCIENCYVETNKNE